MNKKVSVQPYLVLRSKKDHDQYIANVVKDYISEYMAPHRKDAFDKGVYSGTAYGLDMSIIALGRMGIIFDPVEFMKNVGEVANDYGELFDIDLYENHDDQYWWSGSKLDKELFEYISPDIYPTFEERYKRERSTNVKKSESTQ